ncbi:hypothetical protein BP6252_03926 [Coleophoma cylindrospora]|uniref:Late sexual development protein n=1 Tax=Coleophoma cylindrospora TaxID=1849047 RepID=A0A3D8S9M5_9HELO|nr:hypothetical protein BP6252_03926 [Coleophoma cylindrospora]
MVSSLLSASLMGLSCLSAVAAAPFSFPLADGFPAIANPSQQLTAIEQQAHGSLPNGPPPATITEDTKTSLRFIAFNELFEVSYFTSLIYNITNNVPGYEFENDDVRTVVLAALTAHKAQEELHTLNANGALKNFGADPIQPCKYIFPVDNFKDAIATAATFTDVTMGTLQEVQTLFGTDGDVGLIRGVGSVIGQEGEQNGFYRTLIQKIPAALPFLTTSTRELAFSALNQDFVVPGSCPNINEIALPIFDPLTVVTTDIQPVSQNIQFSIDVSKYGGNYPESWKWSSGLSGLSLAYINQQNLPVVEKLQNVVVKGNTVTFEVLFPFDEATFGNGLTIAAITNSTGPFASADDVVKATVFAPGLIEIN